MTINKSLKNKSRLALVGVSRACSRGFTLIETLVAITILLIAVVGPISLIGDSLHKLYYAKDQMIAINLAQEGIEVVRQLRDNNMLAGSTWDTGISAENYIVGTSISPTLTLCSSVCDQTVYLGGAGFYRQTSDAFTVATQFKRSVDIVSAGLGTDERKVTSTVTWKTGGDNGTISISEYIYKWAI